MRSLRPRWLAPVVYSFVARIMDRAVRMPEKPIPSARRPEADDYV